MNDLHSFLGAILAVKSAAKMYKDINFKPPVPVAKAAKLGLFYRAKYRRGGTPVGVARAVQLSRRDPVSPDVIRRMNSFFARHAVDRRPDWSNPSNPTNGWIAWLLWGGTPGRVWAKQVLSQMTRRERDL